MDRRSPAPRYWSRSIVGILLLAVVSCGEPEVEQPTTVEIPVPEPEVVEETPAPPSPRARGQRASLRSIELVIESARLSADRLEIELAFENVSDSSFGLIGELAPEHFSLIEDGGDALAPLLVTEALKYLDFGGGIKPGERKVGGVAFPRPLGNTFELRVRGFEPLPFDWQHILETSGGPQFRAPPTSEPTLEPESEEPLPDDNNNPSLQEELPLVDHQEPSPPTINRLLGEHAEAIASYDLDRYLGTFTADKRTAEREIFLRLRSLPLTRVELRIDDIPNGADQQKIRHQGDRATAEIEWIYRFDGLPQDNPFVHQSTFTFAADDDGVWRIDAIDDSRDRPIPWRQGELAIHRSHHFLILSEPQMLSELTAVAADAEAAFAALRTAGLPLASGYAIFFVADRDDFRHITRQANALGAALGRYVFDGERVTVDSRAFYVNGPLFARGRGPSLSAEARRETITHELVHLALAADTRPQTPPWLREGVAVYFADGLSFDTNRDLVRRGLDHLDLDRMTRAPLGSHDPAQRQIADEYLFAGNTVAWLIEQHGREKLLGFYRSYSRIAGLGLSSSARPAALAGVFDAPRDAAAGLTNSALEQYFGLGLAELDAAVKGWLRVPHG